MSVFTRFDFENDVVENQRTKVSSGIFSGGSGTLTTFFTASLLGNVSGSYRAIYHKVPSEDKLLGCTDNSEMFCYHQIPRDLHSQVQQPYRMISILFHSIELV